MSDAAFHSRNVMRSLREARDRAPVEDRPTIDQMLRVTEAVHRASQRATHGRRREEARAGEM